MKDLISVITPFCNSEKYILQCIKSVNEQIVDDTFDIEYILINDCSTRLVTLSLRLFRM